MFGWHQRDNTQAIANIHILHKIYACNSEIVLAGQALDGCGYRDVKNQWADLYKKLITFINRWYTVYDYGDFIVNVEQSMSNMCK